VPRTAKLTSYGSSPYRTFASLTSPSSPYRTSSGANSYHTFASLASPLSPIYRLESSFNVSSGSNSSRDSVTKANTTPLDLTLAESDYLPPLPVSGSRSTWLSTSQSIPSDRAVSYDVISPTPSSLPASPLSPGHRSDIYITTTHETRYSPTDLLMEAHKSFRSPSSSLVWSADHTAISPRSTNFLSYNADTNSVPLSPAYPGLSITSNIHSVCTSSI